MFPIVKQLLSNYARENDLQKTLLDTVENYFFQCSKLVEKQHLLKYYLKFVHELYQAEVLQDYNILTWNNLTNALLSKSSGHDDGLILQFRQKHVIKFL